MKQQSLLFRLAVLLVCMMCALGASAAEAYACYTSENTTLTFYYDDLRSSRTGTTYDMNEPTFDPGWDTDGTKSNVTKVVFDPSFAGARPIATYGWFFDMPNLKTIRDMSYLNTSEVTDMGWMFSKCPKLTSIDVSKFNTAKVTRMSFMFDKSDALTSLDLSSFNTSRVTDMSCMFFRCGSLRTIYVGDGWTTTAETKSDFMFHECFSLVGGQGTAYDANNVNKAYAHIDGGTSNPGYFTDANVPRTYACYTPDNTTLTIYYDNQRCSRPGSTYELNTGTINTSWHTDGTNADVTHVVFDPSFEGARPTTTYDWFSGMNNLQTITGMGYLNTSEVVNMDFMFANCRNLTSLDLSHFNTAKVFSMYYMFQNCEALTSLDLSSFNTSEVAIMYGMFDDCRNLRTIYVGNGWSTDAVRKSENMFSGCTHLVGGQGTAYNESNPKDMTYAHIDGGVSNPGYFTAEGDQPWSVPEAYACYTPDNTTLTFYYDKQRSSRAGTTYGLNNDYTVTVWHTDGTSANVTQVVFDPSFADARPTTTYDWFNDMVHLQAITGMSNLKTSEVTNMSHMFSHCEQLTSLDLSGFNTSNVTSMSYMFTNCYSLTSLDLSNFNTSNVTSMFSMFYDCNNMTSLDLSGFNTSNVTNMYGMFRYCGKLQTIFVGNGWSTAAVTESNEMFAACSRLVGGKGTTYSSLNPTDKTYAHIDGGVSDPGYFTAEGDQPWSVHEAYACYTPDNTTLTFYCDDQRSSRTGTTYDLNTSTSETGWRTDGTNASVTQVVFDPSFAEARPTSTYGWFYGMKNLQSIEGMGYLNTSEVTTMASMFAQCEQLTSLDLSNFNTSKVTRMAGMFQGCSALTSLDLSSFNTSNVNNMGYMFYNCNGLTRLNLSSFNTASVTDMSEMFFYCRALTSLDLSSFNTSDVTNMYCTFSGCSNLKTIYVDNGWSTEAVTLSSYMFAACTRLVGGQGTTYNESNPMDKTYAHIDGGTSNPGYLTAKFQRGDVNGDSNVNISDAILLINYLLNGDAEGINLDAADCNEDSDVNISDAILLINFLLNGTWN